MVSTTIGQVVNFNREMFRILATDHIFCQSQIAARKVGLYSRTSFIYKFKTSTLTPIVKPRNVLNLAIQKVFYIQLCMESAFTYNQGSTTSLAVFLGANGEEIFPINPSLVFGFVPLSSSPSHLEVAFENLFATLCRLFVHKCYFFFFAVAATVVLCVCVQTNHKSLTLKAVEASTFSLRYQKPEKK